MPKIIQASFIICALFLASFVSFSFFQKQKLSQRVDEIGYSMKAVKEVVGEKEVQEHIDEEAKRSQP